MQTASRTSASLYALVLILFAFPFVAVSCNGQDVYELNGYELALGTESLEVTEGDVTRIGPFVPLLLTVVAAALAAAAAWAGYRLPAAALALTAVAGLVIFRMSIDTGTLSESVDEGFIIRARLGLAYWFSSAALLAGAVLPPLLFRESSPPENGAPAEITGAWAETAVEPPD